MELFKARKRFDIVHYVPFLLGAAAVILVAALLVLLWPRGERSVSRSAVKELPVPVDATYAVFESGIVYIDKSAGALYYMDDRMETMWGFSGTTDDMRLYTGAGRVGVAGAKKLQVIDKDGNLVFTKEFERAILDVAMGEKLIAVRLSQSDETILLNTTGEEIDRIISGSNETIIRFGVYATGSVWVITVENAGYAPVYRLSTYKYEKEKTQTANFEEDGQMIYNAAFDDNLCYLFGTGTILVRDCDYTDSVHKDYTVNGFDVADYGMQGKKLHLLLLGSGRLKAISDSGVKDFSCPEELLGAALSKSYYYGFSSYYLYRISPQSGQCTTYRFPLRVDALINGNGFVLVESDGKLFYYALGNG